MKILFVTPFYFPEHKFGGPPRKVHSVASGLAGRGHQVAVATFDSEHPRRQDNQEMDGVPVQYLRWLGGGLKQCPLDLRQLAHLVQGAEVVHVYGLYNLLCPVAVLLARRQGRPVVLEPLGMYPPRARNQPAKRLYNRVFTRWMARGAAAVLAASAAEERDLHPLASPEKIVLRRNGTDVSAFEQLPPGVSLCARWNVAADERIVLFVGRLSPVKNLEQMILAFAQAHLARTRLVLVGPHTEADYVARLRGLIAAQQLGEQVLLAGPLYEEEQKAALSLADLFVLPSLNESFGNAAAEAVAAGVPVLLTDTCGIASMIHERAGLAVPLGVENIARGLQEMLVDPDRRHQLTARRAEVVRELHWDGPIRQTEQLYARLLQPTATPEAAP